MSTGRVDLDPFVGSSPSKPASITENDGDDGLTCAICTSDLSTIDVGARQEHYELHFAEETLSANRDIEYRDYVQPASSVQCSAGSPSKQRNENKSTWKPKKVIERSDVFWHASLDIMPPNNYTPGLVHLLKKALWSSHAQGTTQKAALCYPGTVHISQQFWDKFWGCGYRNYLMACTALMNQSNQPLYFPLLDCSPTPSVRNLQQLIEEAWDAGFDRVGSQQLKHLKNTRKWIGTADLWVAFSYRGIPAELVDFKLQDKQQGVDTVLDWITKYFTPKPTAKSSASINEALMGVSPIIITDRMPLVLQHNGHSRLIVGYEINKAGQIDLLTFDPAHRLDDDIRQEALAIHETSRHQKSQGYSSHGTTKKRLPDEVKESTKRARSSGHTNIAGDDEIVLLGTTPPLLRAPGRSRGDEGNKKTSDLAKILPRFRIKTKKLSKKEYQVLYFPMTKPLTEQERLERKDVISTRIC